MCIVIVEHECLAVNDTFAFFDRVRVQSSIVHIIFCLGYKEGFAVMHLLKLSVANVSAIHDIKAISFDPYKIQSIYIVV